MISSTGEEEKEEIDAFDLSKKVRGWQAWLALGVIAVVASGIFWTSDRGGSPDLSSAAVILAPLSFNKIAVPSTTLSNKTGAVLYRFAGNISSGSGVTLNAASFRLQSAGVAVSNLKLRVYNDSGFSSLAREIQLDGVIASSTSSFSATVQIPDDAKADIFINAGENKYFELAGDIVILGRPARLTVTQEGLNISYKLFTRLSSQTFSGSSTPLTAICSVIPTVAGFNQPVAWTANASGGMGTYAYSWTGSNGLTGTTSSVTKTYGSFGTKSASVNIVSGSESKTVFCSRIVVTAPALSINPSNPPGIPINTTQQLTALYDTDGSGPVAAEAVTPDAVWSSGDRNVARVDGNGLVTGISSGVSAITATYTDNYGNPLRATTVVSVSVGILNVSLDTSSPSSQTVRPGAVDVPIIALRVSATGEDIDLQTIGLTISSPYPEALKRITIWDGATKVRDWSPVKNLASGFPDHQVSVGFDTPNQRVLIPMDTDKVFLIRGDIGPLSHGYSNFSIGIKYRPSGTGGNGKVSGKVIHASGAAETASQLIQVSE